MRGKMVCVWERKTKDGDVSQAANDDDDDALC